MDRIAEAIAAWSPRAVAAVRQALSHGIELPLEKGLDLERRLAVSLTKE